MGIRERLPLVVGAVVALLCQVMLAPYVHVGVAAPNFALAYVIALAVANARGGNYITAFVVGLIYDAMGSGSLGVMAFVCVAIVFVATHFLRIVNGESAFVSIFAMLLSCLLAELAYALLMMACGVDVSFGEALVYRVLPCGLYDMVIGVIAYLLVARFVFRTREAGEMKIIDTSVE